MSHSRSSTAPNLTWSPLRLAASADTAILTAWRTLHTHSMHAHARSRRSKPWADPGGIACRSKQATVGVHKQHPHARRLGQRRRAEGSGLPEDGRVHRAQDAQLLRNLLPPLPRQRRELGVLGHGMRLRLVSLLHMPCRTGPGGGGVGRQQPLLPAAAPCCAARSLMCVHRRPRAPGRLTRQAAKSTPAITASYTSAGPGGAAKWMLPPLKAWQPYPSARPRPALDTFCTCRADSCSQGGADGMESATLAVDRWAAYT